MELPYGRERKVNVLLYVVVRCSLLLITATTTIIFSKHYIFNGCMSAFGEQYNNVKVQ